MDKEEFIKELEYLGYIRLPGNTYYFGKTIEVVVSIVGKSNSVTEKLYDDGSLYRYYVNGEDERDMEHSEILKEIKLRGFYSEKIKREEKINSILQSSC